MEKESRKLRDAFGYIDDEYLKLVETEKNKYKNIHNNKNKNTNKKPVWFYGTIAAACIVIGFAVFTTGVVAADWFGIKSLIMNKNTPSGDISGDADSLVPAGQYMAVLQETNDFISMSGYWDSDESKALDEWNAFLATYDPDGSILQENDKNTKYLESQYYVYSDEMQEKLEEIAAKYNLKLHTDFNLANGKELAYRVGGQFWKECCDTNTAYIYENGTFQFDGDCYEDGNSTISYQFRRSVKGTIDEVVLNIGNADEYDEWQYVTEGGEIILLAISQRKALVYCDFDSCFICVNVLEGTDNGLTKERLEKFADSFDYDILKNVQIPDMRGDIVFDEDWERVSGQSSVSLNDELEEIEKQDEQLNENLSLCYTQLDMNEIAEESFQLWDDELNVIWSRLKEVLSEEEMSALVAEERNWIEEKETKAKEAGAEYEGGSIQPMIISLEKSGLTRKRVYELAGYLGEKTGEVVNMPEE